MGMIRSKIFFNYFKFRKQRQHFTRQLHATFTQRLVRLMALMFFLVFMHTFAMVYFEDMKFGDGLWLTVTTLNTVGYGDFSSATTAGRWSTFIFLYLFGISLLGLIFGEYIEYRYNRRELKLFGQWSWKNMNEHILIINTPNSDPDGYLTKLINEIRKTPELENLCIQIITRKYQKGLPHNITKLDVVHTTGRSEDSEILLKANVDKAKYILIIARDSSDSLSDSLTFDILSRIKDIGSQAIIAAEVVRDENRERLRRIGAHAVVRPVRAYPELIIRAATSPGTEEVLENLFSHSGAHMYRINIEFSAVQWKALVMNVLENDAGLPVAYMNNEGKIKVNPKPDELCSGKSVITMVYEKQNKNQIAEKIRTCLV
ncbi:ion channel [Aliikangiella maris]|uniref:Ion channel n=2 Tax=Aliikangiella maris TaxID=3162458 RepID=A0ABV3MUJ3_9GAMM